MATESPKQGNPGHKSGTDPNPIGSREQQGGTPNRQDQAHEWDNAGRRPRAYGEDGPDGANRDANREDANQGPDPLL